MMIWWRGRMTQGFQQGLTHDITTLFPVVKGAGHRVRGGLFGGHNG